MERTPVITPIAMLFRSRRFTVALASIIFTILSNYVPGLEQFRTEVLAIMIAVPSILILGLSHEDAARAGREAASHELPDIEEQVRKIVEIVLDEMLNTDNAEG
ncbi:MAG: hypothetical protein CUN55_00590 [Phototrophicales bacterium]|nr:MAG: hypothetical protein CUN55_00590 [Phototrophicales bacterium]